jgi:hypothetical protein
LPALSASRLGRLAAEDAAEGVDFGLLGATVGWATGVPRKVEAGDGESEITENVDAGDGEFEARGSAAVGEDELTGAAVGAFFASRADA